MIDLFKSYAPLILRQILLVGGGVLATRGVVSPEDAQFIGANIEIIIGLLMIAFTAVAQYILRPSARALKAAAAIDEKLPTTESAVIKTPAGVPDIPIPAKGSGPV